MTRRISMMVWAAVLIVGCAGSSHAATRYVVASGGSTSGDCTTTETACTFGRANTVAVAGDTVLFRPGTYSAVTYTWTTSGTENNRIVLQSEVPHEAVLNGGTTCNSTPALRLDAEYIDVAEMSFFNVGQGVLIRSRSHNVIRHNIMERFRADGVKLEDASFNTISHNVIALSNPCLADTHPVGIDLNITPGGSLSSNPGADNNIIAHNIIYGTGDNSYTAAVDKLGYGILIANNSDDNLLQGNLLYVAGTKGSIRLLSGNAALGVKRNIIRDNILLWGEGEQSTGDCTDDETQWINNLMIGNYQGLLGTKGQIGDSLETFVGEHQWRHNLMYMDRFTRLGFAVGPGGEPFCGDGGPGNSIIGYKVDQVATDNVIYSPDPQTGFHRIWSNNAKSTSGICAPSTACKPFAEADYNFFWADTSNTATWTDGNYPLGVNDLFSFSTPPTFAGPATGDFELADGTLGTPGNSPASDGTKRGINFGANLKRAWMQHIFALPTAEQGSLGTSAQFTVSPDHFYAVWFHVPNSSPCTLNPETFMIEGAAVQRNMNELVNPGFANLWLQPSPGPARWITLGRHRTTGPGDTTLNISWSNTQCADGVFIRQLPTTTDAYQWVLGEEQQGEIAHWAFDDAEGTTALDETPNQHHGQLCEGETCQQQGPQWTAGQISGALLFDGVNDWVQVPHHSDFDVTGDLSIVAWIKRLSTGTFDTILAKTNRTSLWDYELYLCDDGTECVGQANTLTFYADGVGTVHSTATITDTNWHHVAFVREGSTYTFYVDIVPAGTGTLAGDFAVNTIPVAIGNSLTTGTWFDGHLDAVRVYNVALTAEQVTATAEVGDRPAQVTWRWRQADEPEDGRWQRGAQRPGRAVAGQRVRVRTALQNFEGTTPENTYTLFCRPLEADWFRVTENCSSNPLCYGLDETMTHLSTLTPQLSVPGATFVSGGQFFEETAGTPLAMALGALEYLEREHSLRVEASVTAGSQFGCCERLGTGIELDVCDEALLEVVKPHGRIVE